MDYYCSTKFTDLEVNVQSRLLYNCCKAYPERINLDWLEKNPGQLFYTDTMLQDRQLMLENKPCGSCDFGCYKYERQGLPSQRNKFKNHKFIADKKHPLKHLDISLSTDCNLTCAYCSPEWSTSWWKDIAVNGDYNLSTLKSVNPNWYKLWSKIKQKDRSTHSRFFDLLLKEIKLAKDLESISVLGGEPLLHNNIDKLIETAQDKKITIITGLGISDIRLENFLKKYKNKNIIFKVSCETTGNYFEFLRYGNKWQNFLQKIKKISDYNFKIRFGSTITNITLLDFHNFFSLFSKDYQITLNPVTERPFLLPCVLDDTSKSHFKKWYEKNKKFDKVGLMFNICEPIPNITQIKDLNNFISQFSQRRNINLDFLPKHFLDWLKASS